MSNITMVKSHSKSSIKLSRDDKVFYFFNNMLLGFALLVTLYPIIYIFSSSFSSTNAVISGRVVLFPVEFSLEGYEAVFKNRNIMTGYMNSFIYTVVGTAINVVMTILAAYPLSRKELPGRGLLSFFFTFTMLFNGGMIPTYLLVKSLGLMNTRWALWLPGAVGIWNVIVTRTYFQTNIPEEIMESASIDGCDYIRFLISIVLPLSGAVTAVISMFYAVGHWNAYFNAFMYISDRKLYPLQLVLRDILVANRIDAEMVTDLEAMDTKQGLADLLKYSLIVVACVPVWCIYPFVQKYFVKGIMIGSIKG